MRTAMPKIFAIIVFLVLLAGCAANQHVQPNSAEQALYSAYGAYIAASDSTRELLESDVISVDQARAAQKELNTYYDGLDKLQNRMEDGDSLPDSDVEWMEEARLHLKTIEEHLEEENE